MMARAQDIPVADPAALDADTLLMIHRHEDGHVAICRKLPKRPPGKTFEQLWMLTPAMLRGTFKAFQDWLLVNSYASTQAYFATAPKGWTHRPTGLPAIGVDKYRAEHYRRWGRVTENLRYLNCLSCDIDCGRSDQDAKTELQKVPWRDAQRRVEDLQDAGIIPAVSIYGYSGRGLYVIWLLCDDRNPERSAPAYDHDIVTWKAIQKELVRRVESASLPVDHVGSLITQVYKIGGTLNPATGNRARFFITAQADQHRQLVSYTLSEVAAFLDLRALDDDLPDKTRKRARPAQFRRKVKNPGTAPRRANGYKARHALIARDMLTILSHRLQDGSGGWQKRNQEYADGHRTPKYGRRLTLTLYAQCLVRSMVSPKELWPPATLDPDTRQDLLDRLRNMAANCNPTWPDEPGDGGEAAFDRILDAILSQYKLVRSPKTGKMVLMLPPTPAAKTLCAAFGISADLARELKLKTIVPDEVKRERYQARPIQAEVIRARREWLRDYIHAHPTPGSGGRWTGRKVRDALTPFAPYPWNNHTTANQDLNAIGYVMHRSRGGRPRLQV